MQVRRACLMEGMSVRETARVFGLHRDTVRKMLANATPLGYTRKKPPRRPKPEPYIGVIDALLEADQGFQGNNATRPSASSSGCGTSTGTKVSTP